jgi:hypothetical protein
MLGIAAYWFATPPLRENDHGDESVAEQRCVGGAVQQPRRRQRIDGLDGERDHCAGRKGVAPPRVVVGVPSEQPHKDRGRHDEVHDAVPPVGGYQRTAADVEGGALHSVLEEQPERSLEVDEVDRVTERSGRDARWVNGGNHHRDHEHDDNDETSLEPPVDPVAVAQDARS